MLSVKVNASQLCIVLLLFVLLRQTDFASRFASSTRNPFRAAVICHQANMKLFIMLQTYHIVTVWPPFPTVIQYEIKSAPQPITWQMVANLLAALAVVHVSSINLHTAQIQLALKYHVTICRHRLQFVACL